VLVRRIIRSALEELAQWGLSVGATLDRGRRPHRLLGNSCFPASEREIVTPAHGGDRLQSAQSGAVYASAWRRPSRIV